MMKFKADDKAWMAERWGKVTPVVVVKATEKQLVVRELLRDNDFYRASPRTLTGSDIGRVHETENDALEHLAVSEEKEAERYTRMAEEARNNAAEYRDQKT
jgi:hypothetical protein